jgi:hypothetical protein
MYRHINYLAGYSLLHRQSVRPLLFFCDDLSLPGSAGLVKSAVAVVPRPTGLNTNPSSMLLRVLVKSDCGHYAAQKDNEE